MKAILLFLDIVQLSCGDQLATGTIVKTKRGVELWTVKHFIENCRSEGSFSFRNTLGEVRQLPIDWKSLSRHFYRTVLKNPPTLSPHSRNKEGRTQCRMLSRRLIPDENQRLEEASKLRKILLKFEEIRQFPGADAAALLYLDRAITHGYASWLEEGVWRTFIMDLPPSGEVKASLSILSNRSDSRPWVDDIYAVSSTVTDLRETNMGYTVDCDGWYGSSGGALIDENYQVLGLIEGSQDHLASVFNGIASVGRLRIHKIGEFP